MRGYGGNNKGERNELLKCERKKGSVGRKMDGEDEERDEQ